MTGPVVVLDLDAEPPPAGRPRPRQPGVVSLIVALVVATALTGPDQSPRLTEAWQTGLSTAYTWLGADAVYTIDIASRRASFTAYRLDDGAVRWRVPLRGLLADAYGVGTAPVETRFPPHLADGVRTYVWRGDVQHPALTFPAVATPLVQVADHVAIVIDRDPGVAAAPGYAPVDQAAGLAWAHRVTAIDLASGAVRWTRTIAPGLRWSLPGVRPGTAGIVGLPPGQHWMVTSSSAGDLAVWDLETGAVVLTRDVGFLGLESYVLALPAAVLVWRRGSTGPTIELLDPATLAATARFVPAVPDAEPVACAPAICLYANGGVIIVDATGSVTARLTGTGLRPGPAGRLIVTAFGSPMSIVDVYGRATAATGDWHLVDADNYTRQAVLARAASAGMVDLGLLDVASGALWSLGAIASPLAGTRCQIAAARLVCTQGRQLTAWAIDQKAAHGLTAATT
jgi:hypothetical protein